MSNSDQIRQIVREELNKQGLKSRFNIVPTNRHVHNGNDSAKVSQGNIIPNTRLEGSITFAQVTVYKIGIIFNPTAVWVHGNVTGSNGEKFIVTGNAQLGPSYYLQPSNTVSVVTGGPLQNIVQSTTYYGVDSGSAAHTLVDEGHIVDIFYGGNIHARATIIDFDSSAIYIQVDNLDSGWEMNLSLTVT